MSKITYKVAQNKKYLLDEKDRLILKELLHNSRASVATISETTQILRDTVAKRVQKMKEKGVILGYDTTLDPVALGYNYFAHIFIKLEALPKEELIDFYQKLKDTSEITHITRILGNFDIVLTVVARDGMHFEEIIENIKKTPTNTSSLNNPTSTKKIIEKIEVATITGEDKLNDFSKLI
jgi:DNA-binding Lrp family transcriptional regulator